MAQIYRVEELKNTTNFEISRALQTLSYTFVTPHVFAQAENPGIAVVIIKNVPQFHKKSPVNRFISNLAGFDVYDDAIVVNYE
jgi:hypothetical protein